ncbi:hypothetical protein ACH3VS_36050 [Streptomyces sp. WSLK1-3]
MQRLAGCLNRIRDSEGQFTAVDETLSDDSHVLELAGRVVDVAFTSPAEDFRRTPKPIVSATRPR